MKAMIEILADDGEPVFREVQEGEALEVIRVPVTLRYKGSFGIMREATATVVVKFDPPAVGESES
jgi:hypothetical protein